ncbi:MAG: hypothetical protein J6V36_00565 [Clostridia bacterium]|nr:hypothetical protein [Clostridia bacterium]
MVKKIAISCLLVLFVVLTCACELVKSPEYYELNGDDTVISFTKVVGDRKVNTTKNEMTNAIHRISYSYKDVEKAYEDAETYIDYLTGEEDFYYSGMLNMDEKEDEITLSKASPNNKEYQIRVIIRYNVDTKIVKVVVEREKVIG